MKIRNLCIIFLLFSFLVTSGYVENNKEKKSVKITIEKIELDQTSTIVDVIATNEKFTTLVVAVKAAGLVETLNGNGPFTVFAPLNSAFDKLPEGTVEGLLKLQCKDALASLLKYHVVAGEFKVADILKAIKYNKCKFAITTVQGSMLTASFTNGGIVLTDEKGTTSKVTLTDVTASNGIVHSIDSVVMPE